MSHDDDRVINMTEHGRLLPPAPHLCQQCGRDHDAQAPHDAQSLFYQYWFRRQRGRWPTWGDAMAHSPPAVQEAWQEMLSQHGVPAEAFLITD